MNSYLGLDLDGIIADTDTALRAYIKELFGETITRDQITSFFYEDCLNFSDEKISHFWREFNKNNGWGEIKSVNGALETLNTLKNKYKYIIVTSRPENLFNVTRDWLEKHNLNYEELIVTSKKNKSDILREGGWNISCFIEDRVDFATDIAKSDIPVLLYDYPWNQSENLHKNIKRVFSWQEIKNIL
ncbi:MAG: HAD hydrolase-like protein [Elusimicrobiota bacterium]